MLVAVSFSKLGAAARLKAWISAVALTASEPDTPWGAATVGRGRPGHPECATLTPLTKEQAVAVLEQLVELYDLGLREPLPMPVKSAAEYAEHRFRDAEVPERTHRAKHEMDQRQITRARTTTVRTYRSGDGARRSRHC